jgi:hypothetical protein
MRSEDLTPRECLLLINHLGEGTSCALYSLMSQRPSGAGCVFKRAIESSQKLVSLVESVAEGLVCADPFLLSKMLGRDSDSGRLSHLSLRKISVLELMARI